MKNYIKNISCAVLFGAAMVSLSGCGDFLNIEPKNFVSEDNFWNEKADIEQMVAGVYVQLQDPSIIERCIVWGEGRSDNFVDGNETNNNMSLYRMLRENLLPSNAYTSYASFYKVINACNVIIERAPEVSQKDPTYTESQVKATQAEMKAIRSLCYFYLVRAFKDVPYTLSAIQSEDDVVAWPAVDGDQIVRTCIAELESCVSDALKAYPKDAESDRYNSNCNRITQNAIYALLCDMCLWNGDFDKVVAYADKIITYKNNEYQTWEKTPKPVLYQWANDTYSNGYYLYPSYFSLGVFGNDFDAIFGEGNSFESIFELNYSVDARHSNYVGNSSVRTLFGGWTDKGYKKGFLGVNDEILLIPDGSTVDNTKVFNHRFDARCYTNLLCYSPNSNTTIFPAKFVVDASMLIMSSSTITAPSIPDTYDHSEYDNANWIFYRLTDVMLMKAEALINLNRDDEAFSLIYVVNRRSIMDGRNTTVVSPCTQCELNRSLYSSADGTMMTLLLEERRREFMFEGKRWFDLLRQDHQAIREGKAPNNAMDLVNAKSGTQNYEALYWPYNKYELKNNTSLSQKPYYAADGEDGNYSSTK